MTANSSQNTQALFDRMIEAVPRKQLWPAAVGLLQHLLLADDVDLQEYHYGMFAIADTLRDAACRQEERGVNVRNDIGLLSKLRRAHLHLVMQKEED